MNSAQIFDWLVTVPPSLTLLGRCTAILILAWVAHAAMARQNPRWRVLLWRSTAVGLAAVAGLAALPRLVVWPVSRIETRALAVAGPTTALPVATQISPGGETPTAETGPHAIASRPLSAPSSMIVNKVSAPSSGLAPPRREVGTPLAGALVNLASQGRFWFATWSAGVVILAIRLAFGTYRLARIVERSRDVPGWITAERDDVAERLGVTRSVLILTSDEIRTPCLSGLRRLVLLLPADSFEDENRADLRAILAHELAHARGHDLAWNDALHLVAILLWFHPLAWRIRATHAAACDAVCDAVAADLLGNVPAYGRSLARIALRVAGSLSPHGLAMARTSDVRRRIEFLQRKLFRSPIPRSQIMPALFSASVLVVLIGGIGITLAEKSPGQAVEAPRADAPPAKPAEPPAPRADRMTIRVTDAATGMPLEGVQVKYRLGGGEHPRRGTPLTDAEGSASIELPPDANRQDFVLWITKSHYVPAHVSLDGRSHPLNLPAVKSFALEPGTTIGGVVRDEQGRPIEGATVNVDMPPTETDQTNMAFTIGNSTTDAEGRWHIDEAPTNLGPVSMRIEHPKFRRNFAKPTKGLESVVVLTRGRTVRGHVVDADGKPVKGAKAAFGHDIWGSNPPEGVTDANGDFSLENCDPGPSLVTIQADGFSPQFQEVRVAAQGETKPVEFRLGPAGVIRGRLVDREGKPIAGAFFAADTWRGHRSIMHRGHTDAEGRFSWESAPLDPVIFHFGQTGYMANRNQALQASAEEQKVVLDPVLTIAGRVTDAKTGKLIPSIRVTVGRKFQGRDQVFWSPNEAIESTDGTYSRTFNEPSTYLLRFEAPGYATKDSREFHSNEGSQTLDVALEPAEGLVGAVVSPDGKPVAGASVALATLETPISRQGGVFDRNSRAAIVKTDAEGRFQFPPQDDRYLLIAVSDAGFADASSKEFAASGKLVLQPWGKIDGKVRIGQKPGADQEISFQPTRPERGGGIFVFDYGYTTQTDAAGYFRFDRVIPGPGTVSRVVVTEFVGGSSKHMPGWPTKVDVPPGGAAEVTIGGHGRPVIGRVTLDEIPDAPIDWVRNEPAQIHAPRSELGKGDAWVRFGANIGEDGRFRIDDVPPGRYELEIPVNKPPDPRFCGAGATIGRAILDITVPEGPDGVPFELGDVVAKLLPTLKVGDLAPDFTAKTLDGGSFRLSDRQGKLVLLDFWATWCGPCLAEMPAMKELQKQFGGDPRFEIVGLAGDQEMDSPARYARENALTWTQAFAGSLSKGIGASYKVRAIPATFLIGPDGRILARNLRGPDLKEAVREALANDELFTSAKSAVRAPRFPVTRFEVEPNRREKGGTPAVIVLSDSDLNLRDDRPHRDILSFRDADGRVLHTLEEFHVSQSVGAAHVVAIDRQRNRVYVCENVAHCVTALDLHGRKLWRVDQIDADTLAVDPKTGNLWCSGGPNLSSGATVVLDAQGNEVASYPDHGIDIAYDPKTVGFWLVGYGIKKLSREGKVLFERPHEGWACVSVAVYPNDGSVWIGERNHPDVAHSRNRLWHLDASGNVLLSEPLDELNPYAVACDPKSGTVYVANLRSSILRFSADGRPQPPASIPVTAVSVSPSSGQLWATTATELLRLDHAGAVQSRTPLGADSLASWPTGF